MADVTRLTKTDLAAIEARVRAEVAALGAAPTIESLEAEGYRENKTLNAILDAISGSGRVITLLIAEAIQSGAALIIAVVFAILEYWRVWSGAGALGQSIEQANLIAFAVVTANIVHPIYSLRHMRGVQHRTIVRQTGRGYFMAFIRRLTGRPTTDTIDWTYNPTLDLAAMLITWTTVILAVYDLVVPILSSIITGTATKPTLILVIELIMGLGLSLAGVFFLQSAAHEIGVRTLTDQPQRLGDVLSERRAVHDAQVATVRERITAEYHTAKIQDAERKVKSNGKVATEDFLATQTAPRVAAVNGSNGNHSGRETHSGA